MSTRSPTPGECLDGARLCLANATSLYLASSHLRRGGFNREAVLLLATTVEELAKAGILHRAWFVRDDPSLFEKALSGWERVSGGAGAHARKHASAAFVGSWNFAIGVLAGALTNMLAKDRAGSATADILDTLLGLRAVPPVGWYGRLWQERQAIYVDWSGTHWAGRSADPGAFYDAGRLHMLPLLHILRSDIRSSG